MKNVFLYSLLLLLFIFTFSPIQSFAAGSDEHSYTYVALGDSLTAGFLNDSVPPDYNIGKGYPDFIEQEIEAGSAYQIELINGGIGGFTTEDVLSQMLSNDQNIMEHLANADMVTIGIGANDLLGAMDLEDLNPGVIDDVSAVLEQVEANLNIILEKIGDINPDAPVYVMGYYNALHYMDDDMQGIIEIVLDDMLNVSIENTANANDAFYVPTIDFFDGKYEDYLPNPDIHPNEQGYQAIADAFMEHIPIPIDNVIEAEDVETMQSALENENLGLDLNLFHELNEDNQMAVAEAVLDQRPEDGYESTAAVQTVLDETVNDLIDSEPTPMDQVNEASQAEDMQDALENDDLGLDLNRYNKLSDDHKSSVAKTVLDNRPSAGYAEVDDVQDVFEDAVQKAAPDPEEPGDDGHVKVTPGEETAVQGGEAVIVDGTNTSLSLPSNLREDTMLTVTNANDEDYVSENEGLEPAGSVFHFDFDHLSDNGQTFELTLDYNLEKYTADEVAIYYYNEASGKWEKQNGIVDEKAGTITIETAHFSTYGVFAVTDKDKEDDVPVAGENEEKGFSGSDDDSKGVVKNHEKLSDATTESGGELPDTATNNPLFILIGAIMTIFGGAIIIIRKKSAAERL
ncbi:GDSL-type esterase/lipase family protein [Lentibacillus sp. CBA3610]|uniref:GDSL-type esterase/lipase family protein n=1 Tax=Lentibacillus sp. CBA3610 TaxID=2518176 RepID=UPI0020D20C84|nr:GDSL-type esterase/lipase family protein [Lentibacillus sp. CBA3610]